MDSTCSVNADGSACVLKAACSTYTETTCAKGTDAMCFWNSACVPITTPTDCALVIKASLSDMIC